MGASNATRNSQYFDVTAGQFQRFLGKDHENPGTNKVEVFNKITGYFEGVTVYEEDTERFGKAYRFSLKLIDDEDNTTPLIIKAGAGTAFARMITNYFHNNIQKGDRIAISVKPVDGNKATSCFVVKLETNGEGLVDEVKIDYHKDSCRWSESADKDVKAKEDYLANLAYWKAKPDIWYEYTPRGATSSGGGNAEIEKLRGEYNEKFEATAKEYDFPPIYAPAWKEGTQKLFKQGERAIAELSLAELQTLISTLKDLGEKYKAKPESRPAWLTVEEYDPFADE